ncbi:hypothetical protein CERSUDRAFT_48572 [Gelatoporia subvermispora B]|uniref:HAT C-terminal dimerisation domain-containing protein n=1 Tax=Ceriporiopsis subvermispora (strain B) TaxID=914234 RepID=M2PPN1_CERS8|nr:hypothetical protein CERSUDRAFT_48572 [Gelatoporia subvermispora B]
MGSITMDSAGNNDTQMVGLEGLFAKEGILFDHDGNRIRLTPELLQQRGAYVAALERQPVKLVRDIVSACRRSGERRAELQRIIADGNEHRQWEDGVKLPAKQLLRDCETRWSSTFMMIGRLLGLYPAVRRLLLEAPENTGLANLTLNTIEQQLLMEIYYILRVAHSCQQVLSTQRTPTLSMALPSYELVMLGWTALKTKYPLLASYIDVGLQRIEKYIALARKSRIYALAMIINPIMKLDWIQEHWKPEDARQARRWIIEVMTAYATQRRHSARERPRVVSQPLPVSVPSSSKNAAFAAAFGEESGMDFLMSVTQEVRGASLLNNHRSTPAPPISTVDTSTSASSAPIEEDIVRAEEDALRADQLCAEHELNKYLDEPPPFYKKEKGPDLVNFWDNAEHRLPLLFKVAMDVLPAQASAVPCELLLGILQVLKFLVKEERLSFTDDLVACEDDYDIDKALTDDAVNELLAAGKYAELEELLKDARRT